MVKASHKWIPLDSDCQILIDRMQCKNTHKLKHYFYSPNIQSKSIIDSQTRTVKIQPFFVPFFFLHRGPLHENSGWPSRIYMLSFHYNYCMLMIHYLYKLFKWPCKLSTLFLFFFFLDLAHVVFANHWPYLEFRKIQPITEKHTHFDFQISVILLRLYYVANQSALTPSVAKLCGLFANTT